MKYSLLILLGLFLSFTPTWGNNTSYLEKGKAILELNFVQDPLTFHEMYQKIIHAAENVLGGTESHTVLKQLQTYAATLLPVYTVQDVVDGDTLELIDPTTRQERKVRLIGIDAPESTTTRYGYTECFGKEATQYLTALIEKKSVRIAYDPTQSTTDKYGRTLAYVFSDATLVNEQIIAEGYAREYTYSNPYLYQTIFKKAQRSAEISEKGLRSSSTCNGERMQTTPSSSPPSDPLPADCAKKEYCKEMTTCDEAMRYLETCGLKRLDNDGDGIPCESVCSP